SPSKSLPAVYNYVNMSTLEGSLFDVDAGVAILLSGRPVPQHLLIVAVAAGEVQALDRPGQNSIVGHPVRILIWLPGVVDDQLVGTHAFGQLGSHHEIAVIVEHPDVVVVGDSPAASHGGIDEGERLAAMP